MSQALRKCGRDIVFSLSNSAPFEHAADWARLANCWRTTGDIWDRWDKNDRRMAVRHLRDRLLPGPLGAVSPGRATGTTPTCSWSGYVGWGPRLHPTKLTPDEQYTHISLWCLLSAPLLIGCDMDRLDRFTLEPAHQRRGAGARPGRPRPAGRPRGDVGARSTSI